MQGKPMKKAREDNGGVRRGRRISAKLFPRRLKRPAREKREGGEGEEQGLRGVFHETQGKVPQGFDMPEKMLDHPGGLRTESVGNGGGETTHAVSGIVVHKIGSEYESARDRGEKQYENAVAETCEHRSNLIRSHPPNQANGIGNGRLPDV